MLEEANSSELIGWKAVAGHLGVDVRTAQRYEVELGLPVRRLPGEKGRVRATAAELDEWKKKVLARGSWWRSARILRWWAVSATLVLGAVLVALLTGLLGAARKGEMARFRLDDQVLSVSDAAGRDLWRYSLPQPSVREMSELQKLRHGWFGDLDGDSRTEFLFVYAPLNDSVAGHTLYCFSDRGSIKWKFAPGRTIADATQTYSRVYFISGFRVLPGNAPNTPKVVVSSNHSWSYPNQIATLEAHGAVLGEYWHSGHLTAIETADLDGDGRHEILAAGVNNGRRQATLVVLDPQRVTGASVQPAGDAFQLRGFAPAEEKALLLFPRTCITEKLRQFNQARDLVITDSILIQVSEADASSPGYVMHVLDRDLRPLGVDVSVTLKSQHKQYEITGYLDHSLSQAEIDRLRQVTRIR